MKTLERLTQWLGELPEALTEVRVRAGRPVQYRCLSGEAFGRVVEAEELPGILSALTDYSLYARDAEFRQGFFTMEDGCRVGICGRLIHDGARVTGMDPVGSLCVRVAREIPGAADGFYDALFDQCRPRSALIVSPPGMGKTTALRAATRRLSEDGFNVCIADERHELAAGAEGVPTLDVGLRTDVMDGGPKHVAIARLLRAASPQVIVTDEIGDSRDAGALADAIRCGVAVIASAHGDSFDSVSARGIPGGVFSVGVLLGDMPGRVKAISAL